MSKKNTTVHKSFTWKEITWYVISGLFILSGVVLGTLSIIGDYIGPNNVLKTAQQSMINIFKLNLSWRGYGLIFIAIGVIILLCTLYVSAKRNDKYIGSSTSRTERTKINLDAIKTPESVEVNATESTASK